MPSVPLLAQPNRRLWYQNDSFCGYNVYLQWVVTIFMILFGVNFNAYYLLFFGHIRDALKVEEVRYYFGIIIASVVVISVNIAHMCTGVFDAVTKAAFQLAQSSRQPDFPAPISTDGPSFQRHCLCF